ncbi:hypothetical protein BC937DRAFT_89886 [Endogone sp. FLAS-F59071]|nr:hypothetical protein BC937DRAFT_89886 [Endogone sp. FLAS-F59071]|eukprot:RUS22254.1 hypothetical protein BC937DRAFT_89886 [Endogone sp. FLAS-F59071]
MATLLHTFPNQEATPDTFALPQGLLAPDADVSFVAATPASERSPASVDTPAEQPQTEEQPQAEPQPQAESQPQAEPQPQPASTPHLGLEFWNRQREEWTNGQWRQPVDSEGKHNPALAHINDSNINAIYDSLVTDKKRLIKPIPLPYVINVLVSGWKRDGVWPANMEARDSE